MSQDIRILHRCPDCGGKGYQAGSWGMAQCSGVLNGCNQGWIEEGLEPGQFWMNGEIIDPRQRNEV
jgi:hypothetical protein